MVRYIFILLILATGCSVDPVKVAQVGTKAVYVDELIKSGAVLDAAISSSLSESDVQIISAALAEYNKFRDDWGDRIKKDPLKLITDIGSFQVAYQQLRDQYFNVEDVVQRNWDSYGDGTKLVLKDYKARAIALDILVLELLADAKASTAIIAIEEMAVVVGRIALAVL
jgi:hypothetical protein